MVESCTNILRCELGHTAGARNEVPLALARGESEQGYGIARTEHSYYAESMANATLRQRVVRQRVASVVRSLPTPAAHRCPRTAHA